MQDQGVAAGEERAGVRFAKNMCPSEGTMDIFVEPVLPLPQLLVCGSSPVAVAVADLGRRIGFALTVCAPAAEQTSFAEADRRMYSMKQRHHAQAEARQENKAHGAKAT